MRNEGEHVSKKLVKKSMSDRCRSRSKIRTEGVVFANAGERLLLRVESFVFSNSTRAL